MNGVEVASPAKGTPACRFYMPAQGAISLEDLTAPVRNLLTARGCHFLSSDSKQWKSLDSIEFLRSFFCLQM